jgi:predicted MPP superfamily phosphohydrolase
VNINWWDGLLHTLLGISARQAVAGENIVTRLNNLVDKVNQLKPSFIVLLGDATESATPQQFQRVLGILKRLEVPVLALMGNHDIWPYLRQNGKVMWNASAPLALQEFEGLFSTFYRTFPFPLAKQNLGFQNYAFTAGDTKFIILDNINRDKSPFGLPGAAGWSKVHLETRRWLQDQLTKNREEKVIILSHAPLSANVLKKMPTQGKRILCIAGHTHKINRRTIGHITQITIGALLYQPLMLEVDTSKNLHYYFSHF